VFLRGQTRPRPKGHCWGKRVQQLKKRKKIMFFYFQKTLQNVTNVHIVSQPLNHSAFNTQLPKVSTGQSPTSNILL